MSYKETLSKIRQYYDRQTSIVPPGSGLVWFMSQDQLHPPMINQLEAWTSPEGWKWGAEQTVRDLLNLMKPQPGETILDVGSGIGGPGRLVAREFGARVIELNLSSTQLRTDRLLSNPLLNSSYDSMDFVQADGHILPIVENSLDHAISINMFYHFMEPSNVATELAHILKPGGLFGLDDWFLTNKTKRGTLEKLRYEWSSPSGFHKYSDIVKIFERKGLKAIHQKDLTRSGVNYLNEKYFGNTFDTIIRPIIKENFPKLYQYDGYQPEHAEQAADQLKQAILLMGDLYRNGEAQYRQVVFQKR